MLKAPLTNKVQETNRNRMSYSIPPLPRTAGGVYKSRPYITTPSNYCINIGVATADINMLRWIYFLWGALCGIPYSSHTPVTGLGSCPMGSTDGASPVFPRSLVDVFVISFSPPRIRDFCISLYTTPRCIDHRLVVC